MTIVLVLELLVLAAVTCILLLQKSLSSYSVEKGKNLATKEDIGAITTKIESIKLDHARQLESARAELSSQINNHGFRYEKEYQVLSELSALLVDVRDASLSLRPRMDLVDPDKTDDEIKRERLTKYGKALRKLYSVREKKRPFYPEKIYQAIRAIENISRAESIEYTYRDPHGSERHTEYWEEAEANQGVIVDLAEDAMREIRERVTKWEAISDGL